MSDTLYRKYRPSTFEELTGQNHVKLTLLHQIESGKTAHAYLFTGPRGVGKTTTARLFAAAINGAEGEDAVGIIAGRDLDIIEIDAASYSGVENVREQIVEHARFTPQRRKYKVFIIDEVHMLSTAAFNALLKVIEEPPKHAIFILATTELYKVPATIISRCQRFDFKKIPHEDMMERLKTISRAEEVSVDESVLVAVARAGEGCLRDAESLLGQVLALGDKHITQEQADLVLPRSSYGAALEFVEHLVLRQTEKALTQVNDLIDNGVDMSQFCKDILEVARLLLLSKASRGLPTSVGALSQEQERSLLELADRMSMPDIVRLIDLFAKKRHEIKGSVMPQLPLEVGIVEFTQPIADKAPNTPPGSAPTSRPSPAPAPTSAPEKPDQEPEQKKNKVSLNITVEQIRNKWTDLLFELQKLNPSLVLVLKTAEPLEVKDGRLVIGYKYPFHKERMEKREMMEAFSTVCEKLFGCSMPLENTILPKSHDSEFITKVTQQDEVEMLADAFVAENTTSIAAQQTVPDSPSQDDLIGSLVQAFGGRVVE